MPPLPPVTRAVFPVSLKRLVILHLRSIEWGWAKQRRQVDRQRQKVAPRRQSDGSCCSLLSDRAFPWTLSGILLNRGFA
jgi:hypothetical protein